MTPPSRELNFPIDLALSVEQEDVPSRFLFVASSNFDLRYNAGVLHTIDLERALGAFGDCQADCEVDLANADPPIVTSEVEIASFAAQLEIAPEGNRIYLPVRSDANLTVVDVDSEGRLSCGGEPGVLHRCTEAFEVLDESIIGEEGLSLPADPVALAVVPAETVGVPDEAGTFLLMTHRDGAASLSFDPRNGSSPTVLDVEEDLASNLEGLGFDARTRLAWLPSAAESRIARVGLSFPSETPSGFDARLYDAGELRLTGVDTGGSFRGDLREVRFDPRPDVEKAYMLARRPESLLTADVGMDDPRQALQVDSVLGLCDGPSRLEVREWLGRLVGFASCFDGRAIYVVDLERNQILGVARGMSGPFEIAIDLLRETVFVVDFGISVVSVIDLAPLRSCLEGESNVCSPTLRGTFGVPRPVDEIS